MAYENRLPHIVLVFLLGALALVFGRSAHSAASDDADLRELSRYTLTMADIRKYAAANSALAGQPKVEESDDSDDGDDDESLDEMTARIEKIPAARQAIEGAGLSARQFAVITMALLQASLAQFAIEQGADPAKVARDASVNPANIRFVKEHKAELQKLNSSRSED